MTDLDDDREDPDTGISMADELAAALAAAGAATARTVASSPPSPLSTTIVQLAVAGGLIDVSAHQSVVIGRGSSGASTIRGDVAAADATGDVERLIRVDHPLVSRRHLRVHVGNGTLTATDLNSRNGVSVLRDGATLAVEPGVPFGLRTGDVAQTVEGVVLCEVVAAL